MEKKPQVFVYYGEKITLRFTYGNLTQTWEGLSRLSLNLLLGLIKTAYPQVEIKTYQPAIGKPNQRNHSRFTLIEALVIILIVGILTFGAVSAYMSYANRIRAENCLNRAYLLLKETQLKAHLEKKPYEITLNGSEMSIKPSGGTTTTYNLTPCEFGNYTLHLNKFGVFELNQDVEITNLAAPPEVKKKIIVSPFGVFSQ